MTARKLISDLFEGRTTRDDFTKKPLGAREITSKAWILPNDKVVDLKMWHAQWLENNAAAIKKKFGLVVPIVQGEGARVWALNNGFTRINYEHNKGRLTVETNRKFWTKKRRDAIWMFVFENARGIDNITINVLNDKAQIVKQGETPFGWLSKSEQEKVDNIPLINEGVKPKEQATDIGVWKSKKLSQSKMPDGY